MQHNDKEVIFHVHACPDDMYMIHESVRELVRCADGERKDQDFEKRSEFQKALMRSIDPECLPLILKVMK